MAGVPSRTSEWGPNNPGKPVYSGEQEILSCSGVVNILYPFVVTSHLGREFFGRFAKASYRRSMTSHPFMDEGFDPESVVGARQEDHWD